MGGQLPGQCFDSEGNKRFEVKGGFHGCGLGATLNGILEHQFIWSINPSGQAPKQIYACCVVMDVLDVLGGP